MTRFLLISSRRVSGSETIQAVQRNGSGQAAILISEVEVADGLKVLRPGTQTIKGSNGLVLRNESASNVIIRPRYCSRYPSNCLIARCSLDAGVSRRGHSSHGGTALLHRLIPSLGPCGMLFSFRPPIGSTAIASSLNSPLPAARHQAGQMQLRRRESRRSIMSSNINGVRLSRVTRAKRNQLG